MIDDETKQALLPAKHAPLYDVLVGRILSGRITHLYRGSCPDGLNHELRDEDCVACIVLAMAEGGADATPASMLAVANRAADDLAAMQERERQEPQD